MTRTAKSFRLTNGDYVGSWTNFGPYLTYDERFLKFYSSYADQMTTVRSA